jgi:exoribonuclease R
MKFPTRWSLPKSIMDEGQLVSFDVGLENLKGLSFVCKIDDTDIELTLSKVLKIIKLNKEREIKERLFKETVEQLKNTFEKTNLDKLQKLYFDFEKDETILNTDEERSTIELVEESTIEG